jgi:hypothetical protein
VNDFPSGVVPPILTAEQVNITRMTANGTRADKARVVALAASHEALRALVHEFNEVAPEHLALVEALRARVEVLTAALATLIQNATGLLDVSYLDPARRVVSDGETP